MAVDSLFPLDGSLGDTLALRVGDESLSHAELRVRAGKYATFLQAQGIVPGARVGLWTQRSLLTPMALFAHAQMGAISVPLNPSLGSRELEHVLSDSEPALVVAPDPAALHPDLAGSTVAYEEIDSGDPLKERTVDDEPMLILYTSGTTGNPKGAIISARNVASNLDGLAKAWEWTRDDWVIHALPLFHVHGLVLGWFGSLRRGGALVWVPRFSPEALLEAINTPVIGTTKKILFAVPTIYHRLLSHPETAQVERALRSLRMLVSGSAGLPLREHQQLEALANQRVCERYGLTETLINCATPFSHPEPGFVGPPVPGVELKLVDDERQPLSTDDTTTIGEVAVRGPSVFLGYLNRPDATLAVRDEEGWFYTGDLATRNAGGSIRILGRRSTDLIKTGGFKVGAGEVEAALLEHPMVSEAAVVGAPDPDLGQRIIAFVVLRAQQRTTSEKQLIDHCARVLSVHKRPREVRFIDELPKNAMGKVVKPRLLEGP